MIKDLIAGKTVHKVIAVPDKLVSIVVNEKDKYINAPFLKDKGTFFYVYHDYIIVYVIY